MSALRVMIDPGHGGRDPGAVAHGLVETDVVLVFADALFAELKRRGVSASLTRAADVDLAPEATWRHPAKGLDLDRRCDLANDVSADAFVSLHCNAGRAAANGAWVLHCKGSEHGESLAHAIFAELERIPGICDDTRRDKSTVTHPRRRAGPRRRLCCCATSPPT